MASATIRAMNEAELVAAMVTVYRMRARKPEPDPSAPHGVVVDFEIAKSVYVEFEPIMTEQQIGTSTQMARHVERNLAIEGWIQVLTNQLAEGTTSS